MKTSIVVTCFNHEKYLKQSLDSILTNHIPGLELIICDDCSSDGSVAIIEQWLKCNNDCFDRSYFIKHKKNQGVTASLNELISLSRGDVISPLASDDYYLPNTLSKRRDFFRKNKKIMGAFSDGMAVSLENEVFSKSIIKSSKLKKLNHKDPGFKEQILFRWNEPMNLQCWRRDVFEVHGGKFKFEDVYCEDLNFALWALSENVFGYIDSTCYAYRCRTWPQTTRGNLKEKWSHMAYLYNKYAGYFDSNINKIMTLRSKWLTNLADGKNDEAAYFSREFGLSVIEQENEIKTNLLRKLFKYINLL